MYLSWTSWCSSRGTILCPWLLLTDSVEEVAGKFTGLLSQALNNWFILVNMILNCWSISPKIYCWSCCCVSCYCFFYYYCFYHLWNYRGDHFLFDSVFIKKKISKSNFFSKKNLNQNQFKPTGFGSIWFFRTKTGSNQFGSVFLVFSVCLVLARFFPVWLGFSIWLGFFPVFSVWIRFGFFSFRLIF